MCVVLSEFINTTCCTWPQGSQGLVYLYFGMLKILCKILIDYQMCIDSHKNDVLGSNQNYCCVE